MWCHILEPWSQPRVCPPMQMKRCITLLCYGDQDCHYAGRCRSAVTGTQIN